MSFGGGVEKWGGPGRKGGGGEGKPSPLRGFNTRRGSANCIFSQKIFPQGPFGQVKLYFEPEKCPAEAFLVDAIVF